MGGGRGRDDDAVDAGIQHGLGRGDGRGLADAGGHGVDGGADRVGDDELVDAVEGGEGVGVEGADPAEADESDAHLRSSLAFRPSPRAEGIAPMLTYPTVAVNHMF